MPTPKNLWILTFAVPTTAAEFIGDLLGDTAAAVTVLNPPRHATAKIEAIYPEEPNPSDVAAKLAVLETVFGLAIPTFTIQPAPPLDWLKKVAEDFPPLRLGRWTVHGKMHRATVPNRLRALQIDATNAFGTGEHPTTRGCLAMLNRLLKTGFHPRRMADIGCGSGILAMACVQATRGMATGVDLDADSVTIARNNARANGLGGRLHYERGRGYMPSLIKRHAPYDLIMANIFAKPLSHMAWQLKNHLRPGGVAILSGLLNSQANMVIAAHRMQGMSLLARRKDGEWSVLAFRR